MSGVCSRQRVSIHPCAVTRRRFPVGASPTRQPLQPEPAGAVMAATKWLKPSDSVSRIGDSASVQAVTRVNAEQALYGAFSVKDFRQRNASFLLRRFLCSISQPFLRPDLRFAHGVARRSRQGWPSRQPFRMLRHARPRLDGSEHDGTLAAIGTTIRGRLAIGRGSSRHNLLFGRPIRT